MKIELAFSICFLAVCAFSLIFGVYVLLNDFKSKLNRVFFFVCVSLSIWAFGFSIAICALDADTCLIWRRFSAFGWGTIWSFILHYNLILTEKKNLLARRRIYLFLYLPALVTLVAFAIPVGINPVPYKLLHTHLGWINVAENNAWDWYYNFYYGSFMLIGLGIIWKWYKSTSSSRIKKQAYLILSSFTISLLIGTLTDIIFNAAFSITIPQIAPIIMLIPVSVIYYSMKRYRLMNSRPNSDDELILKNESRLRIHNYISIVAIAGGFLNFLSQYVLVENPQPKAAVFTSAIMILSGVIIQVLLRLNIGNGLKDTIIIIWISLSIPFFTLQYLRYAGLTIWAMPIIFIVISLLFNKRILLISITISTLMTQAIIWVMMPSTTVIIDQANYIGRIGIFIITILLAFYVHRIYIQRLKENAYQINFQKLIAKISTGFLTINQLNMNEKVNALLEESGVFFEVDHTYLYSVNNDDNTLCNTHGWFKAEINSKMEQPASVQIALLPYIMNLLNSNDIVNIPSTNDLEESAALEIKQLNAYDMQSLISIPIACKDAIMGFIGFASLTTGKKWSQDQINLLRILANMLADALAKVNSEKEIHQLAFYDHLTKIPNRLLFSDRVDQAIELSKRTGKLIGIIFMDLDSFKSVNDTMGHDGGDALISQIAHELTRRVRKSDTVSRFGGDEYLIMLTNMSSKEDIVSIADTIMDIFKKPVILKDQEFFITASAGIAIFPVDGVDTATLIKNADIAMYKAKGKGKNQYVMCSSDMKDEVQLKMKLTHSLYHALDRNELMLYYQPQINLLSRNIIGLEALLRWNHPEMGLISPVVFIPLAEQTGLINPIGEWVLRTSCRQNKYWQDMGLPPIRMAVNVSVNQFHNPNFVSQVRGILQETTLLPEYLELEITESVATKEMNNIISILNNFKELGVSISIDDFGTEYSSLGRLKMLPIDRIKLDMQFVRGIEENEKDRAITKVIINLAKNLELKVIAEGVETEGQLNFLSEGMCDEIQGYYFYQPMPAKEVEAILSYCKHLNK